MKITTENQEWLKKFQPNLEIISSPKGDWLVTGTLIISGSFDPELYEYRFGKDQNSQKLSNYFNEFFAIEIKSPEGNLVPRVREVGGKIEAFQKKLEKSNPDMHFYENGYICIAGVLDDAIYRESEKSFQDFIRELVQPFFYDQLHHKKFGTWPRGEYLHGTLGIIQNFGRLGKKHQKDWGRFVLNKILENKEEQIISLLRKKESIKGHINCLCGAEKPIRKCHNDLFRGLWTLKEIVRKHKK